MKEESMWSMLTWVILLITVNVHFVGSWSRIVGEGVKDTDWVVVSVMVVAMAYATQRHKHLLTVAYSLYPVHFIIRMCAIYFVCTSAVVWGRQLIRVEFVHSPETAQIAVIVFTAVSTALFAGVMRSQYLIHKQGPELRVALINRYSARGRMSVADMDYPRG